MSDDYTPDEVELIDCYAMHLSEHAGEDYVEAQADAERGIARIRADALREAGDLEKLLEEALDANRTFRDANAVLRKKAYEAERLEERLAEESELARRLLIRNASLNGEVATLSRLVEDAKDQPLTLDSLREAWENAEPISEDNPANEGDELIAKLGDQEEYSVAPAEWDRPEFNAGYTARVLHRAPQPEPWQDLADVLRTTGVDGQAMDPGILASVLHERGVRVIKEGDESNE